MGEVLLNFPSPLMAFLDIYVIDIHHILTFQTSETLGLRPFYYCAFVYDLCILDLFFYSVFGAI